ncbi:MAG TPA: type II toxin-antitoxin system VapB family antitoxin [Mycobacterium sp.]|nr:type II toxin-antitoxin system VapB family antitoxin [Mycobacterium sp.]
MIDIDDDALAAAQARLGTSTKVQTVNEALRLAATPQSQEPTARSVIALLADSEIDDPLVTSAAWRSVPHLESRGLSE